MHNTKPPGGIERKKAEKIPKYEGNKVATYAIALYE